MIDLDDVGDIDYETFSAIDIRKVGGHRYARHPTTEVLIVRYLLPGYTRTREWLPRRQRPPQDLVSWVASGGKLVAHNANFERLITRHALRRMHPDFPDVADAQWICTAARAAASGLPRSLDGALKALGSPVAKDEEGKRLIKIFCSPRKPTKKDARTRILPEDEPEEFARFSAYCDKDVMGEHWLHHALPMLSSREAMFFRLDMRMNDRGLPIDIPMARKALNVVQELERRTATEVKAMTGGIGATQVAKMLEMFAARGLDLENMQKKTVEDALKGKHLDPQTRRLLELRVEAGKASTKKLVSMLLCADPHDWVVQGGFLFHGAHTGRYAGRLVQPHNFIRGMLKDHQRDLVFRLLELADDGVYEAADVADVFQLLYEKPIDQISQCMRGFIRAPEGYEMAVVDYTAIEARVLAWVAGEEHMLVAYRAGVDVYKLMAMKLWKLPSLDHVTDEQRRIAKNLVLGCGYQLGGPRFVEYAAGAGCIIEEQFALLAVKVYRKEHPAIVASWKTVEGLVVGAIRNPGKVFRGLQCQFYMREHWLCIRLPSGRELRYPYATATASERYGKPSWSISFRTDHHGQFFRESTYGGKLIENIVQAIARDIMMEGMWKAETGGYPVFGTVHDEVLTMRLKGTSDKKHLEKLVCDVPACYDGIPLAAKGFITERYKKD